jgi:DNA primase
MPEPKIDFKEIKTAATTEQVVGFLGLKVTPKTIERLLEDGTKETDVSWRGDCPFCKCSKSFVISTNKRVYNCFKCKPVPPEQKTGGDLLKLVAKIKGIGLREAALELAKVCGVEKKSPQPTAEIKSFDVEKYAQNLDPEHEALKPLGISADTLRDWKAGYVSNYQGKGARLALPIRGSEGIVAFMGMALDPDNPELSFPKHIDPRLYIFGYGMTEGEQLYLVSSPLDVLRAWDSGFHNALCFLNEEIEVGQWTYLTVLADVGVRTISLA